MRRARDHGRCLAALSLAARFILGEDASLGDPLDALVVFINRHSGLEGPISAEMARYIREFAISISVAPRDRYGLFPLSDCAVFIKMKMMVAARQFRKTCIDAHYASACFRYEKEFCVKFREYTTFICEDDKHTVKVGEPHFPVAAVDFPIRKLRCGMWIYQRPSKAVSIMVRCMLG